jgi:hypothetical protein
MLIASKNVNYSLSFTFKNTIIKILLEIENIKDDIITIIKNGIISKTDYFKSLIIKPKFFDPLKYKIILE